MGQKSLAIYDSLSRKREIANANGEIAKALEGLGSYREALKYMRILMLRFQTAQQPLLAYQF